MTQQEALDILKMGHNVFLTGSAGSGKTYVLNQYIHYLKKNGVPVAVTASTGIAASHMNGVTIHSWSGLGIRSALTPYDLESMEEKKYLWDRFQDVRVLIIDEISMLHHFRLDMVDTVLRSFKRNNMPFGGIQVILCGDFFQLPPVSRPGEREAYFSYQADAWKELKLKICYLTESHRHNDPTFISVLNAIRTNGLSSEIKSHLTKRINTELDLDITPTRLYTHNYDVDEINARALEAMEGTVHTYYMTEKGNPKLSEILKSSCLAPSTLKLKKGAQVMFVKNNQEGGYVNGTLGTIVDCTSTYPIVKTVQGALIKAMPEEWLVDDDGTTKAAIKQVPLRLAWAMTIHKSQGMTLDAAEIDLSKSFEKGMGYVALSRLKSLSGLRLIGFNEMALEVSEEVLMFDEDLQKQSEDSQDYLKEINSQKTQKIQEEFLQRIKPKDSGKKKEKKIESHIQTRALVLEEYSLKEMAELRGVTEETIVGHLETLYDQGDLPDITYIKNALLPDKTLEKINNAVKKSHKEGVEFKLSPVKSLLGYDATFMEIRLARLFLGLR